MKGKGNKVWFLSLKNINISWVFFTVLCEQVLPIIVQTFFSPLFNTYQSALINTTITPATKVQQDRSEFAHSQGLNSIKRRDRRASPAPGLPFGTQPGKLCLPTAPFSRAEALPIRARSLLCPSILRLSPAEPKVLPPCSVSNDKPLSGIRY